MFRHCVVSVLLLSGSLLSAGSSALATQSETSAGNIAARTAPNTAAAQETTQPQGEVRVRRELAGVGALRLLERAKLEAEARQVDVSIAVVDRSGQLLAFVRLGDAAPLTITNAIAKANTAAQLGLPSGQLEILLNDGRPSYLAIQDIVPLQGGVPIRFEGQVIGGIGCSGADPSVDEAIVESVSEFITG